MCCTSVRDYKINGRLMRHIDRICMDALMHYLTSNEGIIVRQSEGKQFFYSYYIMLNGCPIAIMGYSITSDPPHLTAFVREWSFQNSQEEKDSIFQLAKCSLACVELNYALHNGSLYDQHDYMGIYHISQYHRSQITDYILH